MRNPFNFEAEPFEFYSEFDEFEKEFDTELAWEWGEDEEAPGPRSLAMRKPSGGVKPTPVKARILWPALGFPAVIAPRDKPSTSPFVDGDATRCICVLVLSNRKYLSKAEAARYLRYVPWSQRGRRHILSGQAGSFREEELAVRNDEKEPRLVVTRPKDSHGELVAFGGNKGGRNGIVASLGKCVREFYRQEGLEYLHEIRVYEAATGRLEDGLYHLFWNNEEANENVPSEEMRLLIEKFARPRREKLGMLWQRHSTFLLNEYEYEYGALHQPYSSTAPRRTRAEILHPLFVQRRPSPVLRIGQLTDTHVDVRADVYEANLKEAGTTAAYNNWNKSFVVAYTQAKQDSDVVFLTGDLIDYGRGHWGVTERKRLAEDGLYHVDRNWFLFYYFLASGNAYSRPSYTILGNHDWRLNPYPPFAIGGAPSTSTLIHDYTRFTPEQRKTILQKAHGPGHERIISYTSNVESKAQVAYRKPGMVAKQLLFKVFGGGQTLDVPGLPTETTVESVAWYLLSINPFLDYWFTHPAGHGVLMLDWAEDENVIFGDIFQGQRYASFSSDEGPKARNSLTDLQVALVKEFADAPGMAKIIGIHAPPISPWDDWKDDELRAGWKPFNPKGRGYPHYTRKAPNGQTMKGHPLFAIRPAKVVVPDAVHGMDASYNSFEKNRPWFIKRVAEPRSGVRLVLSGHIHRKGLFVVYKAAGIGATVDGEMLIKSVFGSEVLGVRAPAGARTQVQNIAKGLGPAPGPLYVIGTSVGPRGHNYPTKGIDAYVNPGYAHVELANDGTIQKVVFRWVRGTQPSRLVTPQREAGLRAG